MRVSGDLVAASGYRPIILPVALLSFSRRKRGLIWIHNRIPQFPEHVTSSIQYTRRFRCIALLRVVHTWRSSYIPRRAYDRLRRYGGKRNSSECDCRVGHRPYRPCWLLGYIVRMLNFRIAPIGNLESIVSLHRFQSRSLNDSNNWSSDFKNKIY